MPRLLDLFCCQGGAATGYHRAGFDVVGVDIAPQPRYPFAFVQADALEYLAAYGYVYDVIHASPPCQAFTQMSARYRGKGGKADSHVDLLTPTLAVLRAEQRPWIVENVVGAKAFMRPSVVLHGGMFGLGVHRPRLFESNALLMAPETRRTRDAIGVYGRVPDSRTLWRKPSGQIAIRAPRDVEEASRAMGIDWMDWDGLREAIPPAYTEFLGRQLLAAMRRTG